MNIKLGVYIGLLTATSCLFSAEDTRREPRFNLKQWKENLSYGYRYLTSGQVSVGGHPDNKQKQVKGQSFNPTPGITISQVVVHPQEDAETKDAATGLIGGGACGMHALFNGSILATDIITHGDGPSLTMGLRGKRNIKGIIGSYTDQSGALRAYAKQEFNGDGEWLNSEQLHTLLEKVIIPSGHEAWPAEVPFGFIDNQTEELLKNESLCQAFPETAITANTVEEIRTKREKGEPFAATFFVNTTQKDCLNGHWITVTVHTNQHNQTQFTIADSHNEVRLYENETLAPLIRLITGEEIQLACPTPEPLIADLKQAIEQVQLTPEEKNIAHMTSLMDICQRWIGSDQLPEPIKDSYQKTIEATFC